MKKIIRIIIFVLLFIPFIVSADMAAPSLRPFEAVVINDNGITLYNYSTNESITYNKGDKITVYGDSLTELYMEGLDGTILPSDIKPFNETVEPTESDISKLSESRELIITANNGLDIRKGPSTIYDICGHINKDTKIQYTYYYESKDWVTYVYVDSNDLKGWIELYNSNISTESNVAMSKYNGSLKVLFPNEYKIGGFKIAPNTIVDILYDSCVQRTNIIRPVIDIDGRMITLDDESKYFFYSENNDKLDYYSRLYFELKEDVKITSDIEGKGPIGVTIPKDTTIQSLNYLDYELAIDDDDEGNVRQDLSINVYVNYYGNKGWVKLDVNNVNNVYYDLTTDNLTEKVKKKEVNKSIKDIVIICAIVGGIIAVSAVLVIIKANKKNKK
ncbi:MAG: hypothetical protein K5666_01900 [Bacilli bacterium]|nr:hypothetical protein [Bacilli bacterium]